MSLLQDVSEKTQKKTTVKVRIPGVQHYCSKNTFFGLAKNCIIYSDDAKFCVYSNNELSDKKRLVFLILITFLSKFLATCLKCSDIHSGKCTCCKSSGLPCTRQHSW